MTLWNDAENDFPRAVVYHSIYNVNKLIRPEYFQALLEVALGLTTKIPQKYSEVITCPDS